MSVDVHRHFHDELSHVKVRLLTMSGEAEAALTVRDEFISIAGHHRKHVIWRRRFRRCWWPTSLDKHSAVLGLVQDEPRAARQVLDRRRETAGPRFSEFFQDRPLVGWCSIVELRDS